MGSLYITIPNQLLDGTYKCPKKWQENGKQHYNNNMEDDTYKFKLPTDQLSNLRTSQQSYFTEPNSPTADLPRLKKL
ncbi:uncharacterized protein RAG0_07403 [Rhynchosporium agropyri]|uniref:Uncharacterized protein n=1 Tax=Rhynchosporium agropyri TaxID=914238 RepID=A0A1E1KLG1_9HELO|nr:uncharacterized protein RAG0_07403 [Rhynchosporium agropyri]